MSNYDEITITKYETEFVAKHKDFDVIGVGGNEFEALLELSKALGALMFSKETEHKALKRDVARYFELYFCLSDNDIFNYSFLQTSKLENETITECEIRLDHEINTLLQKLSKVGKEE